MTIKLRDLPTIRQEVYALDEGQVTITFPDPLSESSYNELAEYIKLFLRKAKRRVKQSKEENPE